MTSDTPKSATERLHNICAAMEEHISESPFTREEWDRIDAENAQLKRDLAAANAKLAAKPDVAGLVMRIKGYLSNGGLWNPELANHDAVRDLIMDCRDALLSLSAQLAEKEAGLAKEHERAEKFKWQVRDTCTRAEKAEAECEGLRTIISDWLEAQDSNEERVSIERAKAAIAERKV